MAVRRIALLLLLWTWFPLGAARAGDASKSAALARALYEAEWRHAGRPDLQFERAKAWLRESRVKRSAKERAKAGRRRTTLVARARRVLDHVAGHLDGTSVLADDLRRFCARPDAADALFDLWHEPKNKPNPIERIRDHTRLGYALVRKQDGRWELNRTGRSAGARPTSGTGASTNARARTSSTSS